MKVTEERRQTALQMRTAGKTYSEIGTVLGVCANRARDIWISSKYREKAKRSYPLFGLSTNIQNIFHSKGIETRKDVERAFDDGTLRLAIKLWRQFGWVSFKEVARWLDRPEPTKGSPHMCPHCGKQIP